MNSHQRRVYRRVVDRLLPPGTRVFHRYIGDHMVWVVRPRINAFERREYNHVFVERETEPFGHSAVNPRNLVKVIE